MTDQREGMRTDQYRKSPDGPLQQRAAMVHRGFSNVYRHLIDWPDALLEIEKDFLQQRDKSHVTFEWGACAYRDDRCWYSWCIHKRRPQFWDCVLRS